jgi:exopolysaccharide biosynthesis polyprenyl glycosylphosphotransferase
MHQAQCRLRPTFQPLRPGRQTRRDFPQIGQIQAGSIRHTLKAITPQQEQSCHQQEESNCNNYAAHDARESNTHFQLFQSKSRKDRQIACPGLRLRDRYRTISALEVGGVLGILSSASCPTPLISAPMTTSRHQFFRIQVLQLTDALLVWAAFWLAWETRSLVRMWLGMGVESEIARESIHWVLYLAVPFTPLVLEHFRFYEHLRVKSTGLAIRQLIEALLVIALMIGMFAIFAKLQDTRRLVLGIGFLQVFVLLLLRDRAFSHRLRRHDMLESTKERVVIAGTGSEIDALLTELDGEIVADWNIVAHFDLETRSVEDLFDLLKDKSVARVIFVAKETCFDKVAMAVEACELQGVEAWISASFIRTHIARPMFDAIGNKPMLVLRSTPELSWELLCKELFDRVGAFLIIVLSFPLWIFAAIGIFLKSPGAPVLFSQMRAGRYGQPFKMWKFRTMAANADTLLEAIKQTHGNQMEGPVFKLDSDPRIFPFGALLRKFSIDELPQLFNVVKGEMSLVGPRPLPVYEVAAFADISHRRRLSVKPGITCEWQVGGRNKITLFEDWIAMDLRYIDNWSLWLDFTILLRTIPAVLFGKGAK